MTLSLLLKTIFFSCMSLISYEPCEIDWNFIQKLEGFSVVAYVPEPYTSNSGVTIASGFDLGQTNAYDIIALSLPKDLQDKLLPYIGLKGIAALDFIKKYPLKLTKKEVKLINKAVKKVHVERLTDEYNLNSDYTFMFLDSKKQTAIASVAFQYGSLKTRCPKFFKLVTNGQWAKAVHELRNFGDAYPTRRNKEADLLELSIKKRN